MLEWIRNAWLGWQQYTENGKVVALFLAVILFLWFGRNWNRKQDGQGVQKSQILSEGKLLFYYSVAMAIFCICPLTAAVLMMYQTKFYDYQWIWSMVPVTLVIAWGGIVFLTDIWDKSGNAKKIKMSATILGVAGILYLCGGLGQRDGQRDAQYEEASRHAGAVLSEVEEYVWENAGSGVKDGTGDTNTAICLWAPQEIMEAARSHSGEISLPYGRNMWDPALNAYVYETYDESLQAMYQWMCKTDALLPEAELIEALRPTAEEKQAWCAEGSACLENALGKGVNTFLFPGDLDAEYVEWIQEQLHTEPRKVQSYYLFCPLM